MSARDKTSRPALRMSGESISAEVVRADAAGSGGWESEATNNVLKNIVLVSPALQEANNGNWHTAWRWSQMLRPAFDVSIAQAWNGEPFDVMLALHARRSADSIARWAQANFHGKGAPHKAPGLGVVLTGKGAR